MPTIEHEISINAPILICFDVARIVEVHEGKTMLIAFRWRVAH